MEFFVIKNRREGLKTMDAKKLEECGRVYPSKFYL
jgi:hypothetical protein